MIDVAARLSTPDLPELVARLGFRGPDVEAVLAAAADAARSPLDVDRVARLVARLVARIGTFAFSGENPLTEDDADVARFGPGVLPLLALLVSAPEVFDYHRGRGITADVSWRSLSDLGQQAWMHRTTYGSFGLHTYGWMQRAWSGAFYWLGRLQFNLDQVDGTWVLDTHIPATGPLTPDGVDDAFARATAFFGEHFADHPTGDFRCSSWLLDPQLASVLPAGSNLVRFQQRWRLFGEPVRGDDDVLYFVFFRRGPVDLDTLPRDSTLQRGIIDRMRSGGHWDVWSGRVAQLRAEGPA